MSHTILSVMLTVVILTQLFPHFSPGPLETVTPAVRLAGAGGSARVSRDITGAPTRGKAQLDRALETRDTGDT